MQSLQALKTFAHGVHQNWGLLKYDVSEGWKSLRRSVHENPASLALAGAALVGATAGAYFHPVPIERDFGDIAARDMAAKADIAYDVKDRLAGYSSDGRWDGAELIDIALSTHPRRFTYHRIPDMKPLPEITTPFQGVNRYLAGVNTFFDVPLPKSTLEDLLYLEYNRLFSDDTRGVPSGEFAPYHEVRRNFNPLLYETSASKGTVTYEEWLRGKGLKPMKQGLVGGESIGEYARRQFGGSVSVDAQLRGRLDDELDRMISYFSSKANQQAFKGHVDSLADSADRTYNAFLLGITGLAGMCGATNRSGRRALMKAVRKKLKRARQ